MRTKNDDVQADDYGAESAAQSFLIIEAYSFYAENASDMEMLIEDQPFAQAILKSYLEGEPFLFG